MFDMAVLVQAMAARAGIKMKVDALDWAAQKPRATPRATTRP